MLLSYNWLTEYLPDLPQKFSPNKLAEKLTLLGLEVTEVKPVNSSIPGLSIGEVVEKWKHPNADRLNLTKIRHLVGEKEVIDQVVCGADNIAVGQKIILATVGTELSPGFVIKKAKIRGEESSGMVCSREELGKDEKSEGIWVLPFHTSLDTDPQTILGKPDYLLDFDITSNRWDTMYALGVVRETAILFNTSFTYEGKGSFATWEPNMVIEKIANFSKLPSSQVQVTIEDTADCYRYQALSITDIKVVSSPDWLVDRLFLHGLRPVENVVDVTNLILREYGQPIHAFDADKIDKEIIIRRARKGEIITLLDGKKIKLDPKDLVIADKNGPIALAGVMGGLDSGVTSNTKNVLLETAVFDPKRIRQTMIRHQLSTDAGRYFQHRVDPIFSQEVVRIAGAAIAYLGRGKIPFQPIDVFPDQIKFTPKKIILTLDLLNKTLGFPLSRDEINTIFTRLNFSSQNWKGDQVSVCIPSYRQDLFEEWDLIEEITRVYGYNRIPITYPRISNAMGPLMMSPERKCDELREDLRTLSLSMGFQEILTYPFIENAFVACLGVTEENYLKPMNPVWNDISLLRNSLLFGFLKVIQHNSEKKVVGFTRIFETGKVFSPLSSSLTSDGKGVDASSYEHNRLGLAVWEGDTLPHWKYKQRFSNGVSYEEISGAVEKIFQQLFKDTKRLYFKIESGRSNLANCLRNAFTSGSEVKIIFRDQEVGVIGEIADKVKNYFGLESVLIKKKIFYAELDLEVFLKPESVPYIQFKPFSIYPGIRRDLALVMDTKGAEQNIQDILKDLPENSSFLTQVHLSDIYEGENIPTGKKSVVFNLEFTASDRTLKRIEADEEVTRLVKILQKKYNFTLR